MAAADLYLVDSNVMMQAANTYYSFSHAPGFWEWMSKQIADEKIRTVSLVIEEIDFPDQLVEWVADQGVSGFYVDVSRPDIQAKFTEVASWVIAQPFGPEHIAKFLNGADPWIVAVGAVLEGVVVTQEQEVGQGSKKIKIPNVCSQFKVRCINTFEMNDELDAVF